MRVCLCERRRQREGREKTECGCTRLSISTGVWMFLLAGTHVLGFRVKCGEPAGQDKQSEGKTKCKGRDGCAITPEGTETNDRAAS